MIQKLSKKLITILLVIMITLTSFANCFGKFALVRKIYSVNEGINIGSGIISKFAKTIIFYILLFIPVYQVLGVIDFIILNLIEFWTDNNPVGYNEYDKNGIYVKTFSKDNVRIKLTYMNFGQRLNIETKNGSEVSTIVLLNSEPGKLFQEKDGELKEIEINSKEVGDKTIIKLAKEGKLESSKIVNTTELNELKSTAQTNF